MCVWWWGGGKVNLGDEYAVEEAPLGVHEAEDGEVLHVHRILAQRSNTGQTLVKLAGSASTRCREGYEIAKCLQ